MDTQYKLQEERETWQKEKNQLLKQVDETKRTQIQEKDKISELLAEVRFMLIGLNSWLSWAMETKCVSLVLILFGCHVQRNSIERK